MLITHLARYRKAAGLTQAQLAEAVNVSRKTINTVENQVFVPSTTLALKLAQALNVTVHDLFELEGFGADDDASPPS
jgi:putative transcriptional regulator